MCTVNIAIEDKLIDTARLSFGNEKSMKKWLEEQVTALLRSRLSYNETKTKRAPRKHDALMGIINNDINLDYKRLHLSEKYGI